MLLLLFTRLSSAEKKKKKPSSCKCQLRVCLSDTTLESFSTQSSNFLQHHHLIHQESIVNHLANPEWRKMGLQVHFKPSTHMTFLKFIKSEKQPIRCYYCCATWKSLFYEGITARDITILDVQRFHLACECEVLQHPEETWWLTIKQINQQTFKVKLFGLNCK